MPNDRTLPNTGIPGASPLVGRIKALIRESGPIDVADYMSICLTDRNDGYYATRDPFGRAGDFITAPEISQMFGELIGTWLRAAWYGNGCPPAVNVVELGPGRGTLMADMLRVFRLDDALSAAISVHLVETSPHLRLVQKATLQATGFHPQWHDHIETLPAGPCYLVANEFFDAIPFRQFVHDGSRWAERVIGCDANGDLSFGLRPAHLDMEEHGLDLAPPLAGQILEVSPMRQAIAARIASRLQDCGGAGLFIDYGHGQSGYGDTFQALRNHEPESVLAHPGDADLTSHVDFAVLRDTFARFGLIAPQVMSQSDFLLQMGLLERAGRLGRDAGPETREMIHDAVERLAGPDQMGHLFKVLCVAKGETVPHPFEGC